MQMNLCKRDTFVDRVQYMHVLKHALIICLELFVNQVNGIIPVAGIWLTYLRLRLVGSVLSVYTVQTESFDMFRFEVFR